jgi:hypothetical protein
LPSESELISRQTVALLSAGDSVSITAQIPSLPQGTHWIGTAISPSQDDDTTNNRLIIPFTVGLPKRSIVINEIMYAPLGDMPEWIEGYNTTAHAVSLSGWKISDNGTTRALLLNTQTSIAPMSYFIITTDTNQLKSIFPNAQPMFQAAMPSLNNTTPDAVVLYDERGQQWTACTTGSPGAEQTALRCSGTISQERRPIRQTGVRHFQRRVLLMQW